MFLESLLILWDENNKNVSEFQLKNRVFCTVCIFLFYWVLTLSIHEKKQEGPIIVLWWKRLEEKASKGGQKRDQFSVPKSVDGYPPNTCLRLTFWPDLLEPLHVSLADCTMASPLSAKKHLTDCLSVLCRFRQRKRQSRTFFTLNWKPDTSGKKLLCRNFFFVNNSSKSSFVAVSILCFCFGACCTLEQFSVVLSETLWFLRTWLFKFFSSCKFSFSYRGQKELELRRPLEKWLKRKSISVWKYLLN